MSLAGLLWCLPSHSTVLVRKNGGLLLKRKLISGPEPMFSITKSLSAILLPSAMQRTMDSLVNLKLQQVLEQTNINWPRSLKISHIMDQSSGMVQSDNWKDDFNGENDWVKLALTSNIDSHKIGVFCYSNKAVNLIAEMARQAKGHDLKKVFSAELKRQRIKGKFDWLRDGVNNVAVSGGLLMDPSDLTMFIHNVMARPNKFNKDIFHYILKRKSIEERHSLLWWRRKEEKVIYAKGELNNYLFVYPNESKVIYISSLNQKDKLVNVDNLLKEMRSI